MIIVSTPVIEGIERTAGTVRMTVQKSIVTGAGPAGEDGPAGADGPPGADGASAFEVAVAAGFSGSEAAWLASLVGPEGPEGPAGADGAGVVASVVAPLVLTGDVLSLDGSGFEAAGAAADAQAAAEATASGALSTHTADSTAVHGIADTAALVLTSDGRLSDARTPTPHAASHAAAGTDAVTLAQSQVTGLTTDLAAKVPTSRTITAGTGLTGGGDLSANRTLSIASDGVGRTEAAEEVLSQIPSARGFSGTTDTLLLTDAGQVVSSTGASAAAVTIPPNSSVAFPVGTVLEVEQYGAGQVTVAAGSGVTLRAPGGAKTRVQYASVRLRQRAADEWTVEGDTTT